MFKYLLLAGAVTAGAAVLPSESKASEWGCQVLLCLSGDWKGTPSCHPPIYKLIAAMKKPGFDWPTCPQANSTAARFERYDDCPAGWQVGYSSTGHDGNRSEPDRCVQRKQYCSNDRFRGGGHGALKGTVVPVQWTVRDYTIAESKSGTSGSGDSCTVSMSRPLREKPWFIEYDDANKIRQRTWFDLNL